MSNWPHDTSEINLNRQTVAANIVADRFIKGKTAAWKLIVYDKREYRCTALNMIMVFIF